MRNRLTTVKPDCGSIWNRIPRVRRHIYVYALIAFGAVLGTNLMDSLTTHREVEAPPPAPKKSEVLRLDELQDTTGSRYRRWRD